MLLAASLLFTTPPPARASDPGGPGTWSTTSSMSVARSSGTVTLLGGTPCAAEAPPEWCGKVLAVGGFAGSGAYLDSAELYDPDTRAWSPTGGTRERRWLHQTVPLPSGNVLVIGGAQSKQSAEVYDPGTGRWTATARPLGGDLRDFAATLLDDGKVLVTGGINYPAGHNTAQIYDHGKDLWRRTTPMTVGRYAHLATRLADGKVLVIGGAPEGTTAEVYDPVLETWTPTGPLPVQVGRVCSGFPCSTATLLDNGEVLVTGGESVGNPQNDETGRRTSQLFNPGTLSWSLGPAMNDPRMKATATKLSDGRVLITGGATGSPHGAGGDTAFGSAEIYDRTSNSWTRTGNLVEGRGLHAAVLLHGGRCRLPAPPSWCGQVLAMGGGGTAGRQLVSVELFSPGAATRPPSILEIAPRSGPLSGGTLVTITGAGIAGVTSVAFGEKVVQVVQHDEADPDSRITVVSPAHAVGEVFLSVVTAAGVRSSFVSHSRFTFYPSGEWTETAAPDGPKPTAATLLTGPRCADKCGNVLVVGGKVAQLHAVGTGWKETGEIQQPRFGHTQTLLPDGRVLVVGGRSAENSDAPTVAVAEIYDPASGQWTAIDGPVTPRREHTATLLLSGQVLIVGGDEPGGTPAESVASTEIFDPATSSWSPNGSPVMPRSSHRAVLLADASCTTAAAPSYCGKVLLAGGSQRYVDNSDPLRPRSDSRSLRLTELYDPETGSWAPAGELAEPREGHTLTVVSRASCANGAGSCSSVVVTGGDGPRRSTEIFDPATTTWRLSTWMNVGRTGHTATVLADGTLLAAGGATAEGGHASSEVFDPASEAWTLTGPMVSPRFGHFAVELIDRRVLVAGGCCTRAEVFEGDRTSAAPSIQRLEPAIGSTHGGARVTIWGRGLSGESLAVRFGAAPATVTFASDARVDVLTPPHVQGEVEVTLAATRENGNVEKARPLNFTYAAGTWTDAEAADTCSGCVSRYLHTASTLADGKVVVVGGTRNFFLFLSQPGAQEAALRSAQVLDPTTRKWSATGSLATARFSHSATLLKDGTLLVVGGQDAFGNAIRSAEVYDPGTGQWTTVGALATPRFSHSATLLHDGRVLVAGGAPTETRRDSPLPTAEIYHPVTRQWSAAGSLSTARENHTATLLPNGEVLVAGGLGASKSEDAEPSVPPTLGAGLLTGVDRAAPSAIALSSTELFDVASESWTEGPPMAVDRFSHTATTLDGPACAAVTVCGHVLVAGGSRGGPGGTISAELFDPVKRTWAPAANLRSARSGHAAELLPNGTVLVGGGGPGFPGHEAPGPVASAEVFDPATGWHHTTALGVQRAGLTLSPLPDGDVVAVGGYRDVSVAPSPTPGPVSDFVVALSEPAEVYRPAPTVEVVSPSGGKAAGGTHVRLSGTSFTGAGSVLFGDVPAASFDVTSPTELRAIAPPNPAGALEVSVVNAGGTSAKMTPQPRARFTYFGPIGTVTDLSAEPLSESSIELRFTTPDDGTGSNRATRYIVKQAATEMATDAAFDAATTVVGPEKVFGQAKSAVIRVDHLEPATTYYYALKVVGLDGSVGPLSKNAWATTFGASRQGCPPATPTAPAGVSYAGGRYHLVGLPPGTVVGSDSPLYGWFDVGAGGAYSTSAPHRPVEAGRGYWAWSACERLVVLSGAGIAEVSFPLSAFHASMVGNPSSSPATVTGHDFAAAWDAAANSYRMSGYRQPHGLSVGEGSWVFSYLDSEIRIEAAR